VRRIFLLAMLLPFLLLQTLPSGVMPGRSENGGLTLVICTGDGQKEISLDSGTGDAPAPAKDCPWAVLHAAVLLPDMVATDASAVPVSAAEPAPMALLRADHGAAHLPPARAPPLA
jgi:hypothetical protein